MKKKSKKVTKEEKAKKVERLMIKGLKKDDPGAAEIMKQMFKSGQLEVI